VVGEGAPTVTGIDGVRALEVALAVLEAAGTGQRVTIGRHGFTRRSHRGLRLTSVSRSADHYCMAELANLIVPAVAALCGVFLSQLWTTRNDQLRWHREVERRSYEDRRTAFLNFIVALNRSIDATRRRVEIHDDSRGARDQRIEEHLVAWGQAYERYLELNLVLPVEAQRSVKGHLDQVAAWRRVAVNGADAPAPVNEHLIERVLPWLQPQ
jgi:hypothetical protein